MRRYEDFSVGDSYRSAIGRTVTEADNLLYTMLAMNTNELHFNEEAAKASEWGKPLVNSTFTLALVLGLSVADTTQAGAVNLGWTEIRLPHPGLRRRHDLVGDRGAVGARVRVAADPRHRRSAHPRHQPARRSRLRVRALVPRPEAGRRHRLLPVNQRALERLNEPLLPETRRPRWSVRRQPLSWKWKRTATKSPRIRADRDGPGSMRRAEPLRTNVPGGRCHLLQRDAAAPPPTAAAVLKDGTNCDAVELSTGFDSRFRRDLHIACRVREIEEVVARTLGKKRLLDLVQGTDDAAPCPPIVVERIRRAERHVRTRASGIGRVVAPPLEPAKRRHVAVRVGSPRDGREADQVTDELRELLDLTAGLAADFYASLPERPVGVTATASELRHALAGPLPDAPLDPRTVIAELASAADPGIVAEAAGRYFGFVIGGAVPASLAADWLTSAWDQNAGLYVGGPSAAIVEEVAGEWLIDLLGLPAARLVRLRDGRPDGELHRARRRAASRAREGGLGRRARQGLNGAPRIRIIVGEKRHGTIDRALRMLGLGAPDRHRSRRRQRPDARRAAPDRRRADDRVRAGGRGEHRRLRPVPRARRRMRCRAERMAPRRRGVRALGGRLRVAAPARRRRRPRRLVGDRRAQVAECPVRLGHRVHGASGVPQRRLLCARRVSGRRRRDARADRLEPGAFAPRARVPGLCGDSLARPLGDRRDDRALRAVTHAASRRASSASAQRC